MPRIDPIQLLNCLSVLLSPNGGIKSRNEVQRLAGLMTKFSKKLVSKCIYIQILKCTETDLLGLFMASGGWLLVHMWLTESIVAKNWPLVKELLELLLLCPVDIERLKTNNCPKLVKELSKDGNHFAIRALASKLVEQWLKTVKGEHVVPVQEADIAQIVLNADIEIKSENVKSEEPTDKDVKEINDSEIDKKVNIENGLKSEMKPDDVPVTELNTKEVKGTEEEQETLPVLKITLKDGKQVISQVCDTESKEETSDTEKAKDRSKSKEKSNDRRSSSSSSKSSSTKHSSKSHSSSSDKHKSSHRSSSSSSSSSRHKSRDEKSREKDRHSYSSKSRSDSTSKKSGDKSSLSTKTRDDRSSKSSDKERNKDKEKNHDKEKSSDKDKANDKAKVSKDSQKPSDGKLEDKIQPPSIQKLGKIPKLSDVKKEKPSISIEVRKPDEPKPKTVKTFHSKFRKHGLEEEVKPPPSRASVLNKKVTPVLPPTVSIPKRSSPVHNETPPEKKIKIIEPIEKPGSIKLIPPKPKQRDETVRQRDQSGASSEGFFRRFSAEQLATTGAPEKSCIIYGREK